MLLERFESDPVYELVDEVWIAVGSLWADQLRAWG
jgi:hypothetical protein